MAAIPMLIMSPGGSIGLMLKANKNLKKYTSKKPFIDTVKMNRKINDYKKETGHGKGRYIAEKIAKSPLTASEAILKGAAFGALNPGIDVWKRNGEIMKENAKSINKLDNELPSKIHMMEEAKTLEEEITIAYNKLRAEEEKRMGLNEVENSTSNRLKEAIEQKNNKEFDFATAEVLKDASDANIKEAIKKYMEHKNLKDLTYSDAEGVAGELTDILKKSGIVVSKELMDNIGKEIGNSHNEVMKKELDSSLKEIKYGNHNTNGEKDDYKNNKSVLDDMAKANIVDDLSEVMSRTDDKNIIKRELDKSLDRNNVKIHLTDADKLKLLDNIEKKVEYDVDRRVSISDLTKVIKKGTAKKDSIERMPTPEKYDDILAKIEQLKDLNSEYYSKYGENIHKDLKKTISKIKENKPFDIQQSIRDEYKKKL